MASPPIVGVVASAGGIEPLQRLVARLPADFGAALLVAVHLSPDEPSVLPHILSRAGRLPARQAEEGEPIEPGVVLVARPGEDLTVEAGLVRIGADNGAAAGRYRPSGDSLLRSIALEAGSESAGIILSGMMDDGALGLRAIDEAGGLALVQDPRESLFDAMPTAAIAAASLHAVGPVDHLADIVCGWVDRLTRHPSFFTCPGCGGTLWKEQSAPDQVTYRCRVGHGYSQEELLIGKTERLSAAIWAAVVALEERADLMASMARRARERGNEERAEHQQVAARGAADKAKLLRRMIDEMSGEIAADDRGTRDH